VSSSPRRLIAQFLRYVTVGVLSNLVLYVLYLIGTGLGVGPKLTMTMLYSVGVLQTFFLNKYWAFGDRGSEGAALARYCIAYASGYALNYAILAIFVDRLRFSHHYVQGAAMVLLALYLFVLQRTWVFADQEHEGGFLRGRPS
jgi:putative flippase GtrA